jgi:hypothetical protein
MKTTTRYSPTPRVCSRFLAHHAMALGCCVLLTITASARAATVIVPIADIDPNTGNVTLVTNGGFESTGPETPPGSGFYATPPGWERVGDMNSSGYAPVAATVPAVTGSNHADLPANYVGASANFGIYSMNLTLTANTDYVLSAYMWNFGDSTNNVHAVVDLNDFSGEAQLDLNYNDASAASGVFAYGTFNTGVTTAFTVRVFYDGIVGGAYGSATDLSAMWDNVAVTEASAFVAPVPEPSTWALLALSATVVVTLRRRRVA